LRAAYGASVPVKVTSKLPQRPRCTCARSTWWSTRTRRRWPRVLDLDDRSRPGRFRDPLRVDEYSHVRVVSELSNGELHTDSRYVKTSGGCSAPPNRDALHLIGKTC
jgi:sulfur-oxidizing protein SoxY